MDFSRVDWSAIAYNLVAAAIVIFVVDGIWRGLLHVVLGEQPSLKVVWRGSEPVHHDGTEWVHLHVENRGLLASLRTRAAQAVVVRGTIDGGPEMTLMWTTPRGPAEQRDIYGTIPERIVLLLRHVRAGPVPPHYGWSRKPLTTYVTDVVFLTQAPSGAPFASLPLPNGSHRLALQLASADGATMRATFTVSVPPRPAPIKLIPLR